MARARPRPGRRSSEISQVIIAEWFRILPDTTGGSIDDVDVNSLSAAFSNIIDASCVAVPDKLGEPLKIIVPRPPEGVRTKSELQAYLLRNGDLIPGMGAAALFGCGR